MGSSSSSWPVLALTGLTHFWVCVGCWCDGAWALARHQLRAVPIERLKQEYEAEDPSYVPRPAHYRQVLFERLLGRTDA